MPTAEYLRGQIAACEELTYLVYMDPEWMRREIAKLREGK